MSRIKNILPLLAYPMFGEDITLRDEPRWKVPLYRGRNAGFRRPSKCDRHYEIALMRRRKKNHAARIARKINRK